MRLGKLQIVPEAPSRCDVPQDLMAASLIAVLPTLIVFFFDQRYFVQGIVVSGVKG